LQEKFSAQMLEHEKNIKEKEIYHTQTVKEHKENHKK